MTASVMNLIDRGSTMLKAKSPEEMDVNERAKRFGIKPRPDGNYRKPKGFENLPLSQFADPCNLLYGIRSAEDARKARSRFARDKGCDKDPAGRKRVKQRLNRLCRKWGVSQMLSRDGRARQWPTDGVRLSEEKITQTLRAMKKAERRAKKEATQEDVAELRLGYYG